MPVTRYYPITATTTRPSGDPSAEQSSSFPWGQGVTTYTSPPEFVTLDTAPVATSPGAIVTWNSINTTNRQSAFIGHLRYVLGAQNIAAGTWSFAAAVSETNAAANSFFGLTIYVWRPGTGAKVGTIYDTPGGGTGTQLGAEWPTSTQSRLFSVSGSAVNNVQDGDVLIVEMWQTALQSMGTAYAQTWNFNAQTGNSNFSADGQTSLNSWMDAPDTLKPTAKTVTATAVNDSTDDFGSPNITISSPQDLTATGVSNTQTFGNASVQRNLTASGVAGTSEFGTPTTSRQQLSFLGASSFVTGVTTASVAYPAGIEANDLLIYVLAFKTNGGLAGLEPSFPSGKLGLVVSNSQGGGYATQGNNTGNVDLGVYYCIPDAPVTGNATFTGTDLDVFWAQVLHYRGLSNSYYFIEGSTNDVTGNATFTGTVLVQDLNYRLLLPSSISDVVNYQLPAKTDDQVLFLGAIPTDVGGGNQFSEYTLSASGITTATSVEVSEPFSATGTNIAGFVARSQITSGTSSTVPTDSWTISATASGTTTNVRGPLTVVVIRGTAALKATGAINTSAFGEASVSLGAAPAQSVFPSGFDDATDTFGAPAVQLRLSASAVDDGTDAFGTAALWLNLTATAVDDSTDLYGAPALRLNLTASSVDDSTDGVGTAVVRQVLLASAVDDSADGFGAATITTGPVSLTATAVVDGDGFGFATLSTGPVLVQQTAFDDSTDTFGTPTLNRGAVTVTATAVDDSTDSFGTPALRLNLTATAVDDSTDAFGVSALWLNLTAAAVDDSTDLYGTPALHLSLAAAGVANTSLYGTAQLVPGAVTVTATGVASTSQLGLPSVEPGPVAITQSSVTNVSVIGSTLYLAPEIIYTAGASGSNYYDTTTIQVPFPAGLQQGQVMLLLVAGKMSHPMEEPGYPNNVTVTSGRQWRLINSELFLGGYVAQQADQGNTGFYILARNAEGNEPAFESVTVNGMTTLASTILAVKGLFGNGYHIWSAGGEKAVSGTQISVSFAATNGFKAASHIVGPNEVYGDQQITYGPDRPVIEAGDLLIAGFLTPTDPTQADYFSNARLVAPGLVVEDANILAQLEGNLAFDLGGFLVDANVVYGTSLSAVTLEATAVADNDVRGAAFLIAIRPELVIGAPAVDDSTDAFGAQTITRGAVTLSATGVDDSLDVFGFPVVEISGVNLIVSGVDDRVDGFGSAVITTGPVSITATAVDESADEIGLPTVVPREVTLNASSIDDRTDGFGLPTVQVGPVTLQPAGVDDRTDGFGNAQLRLNLTASAIDDSTDAFGAPAVRLNLTASAIDDSTDAFGAPAVRLNLTASAIDDSTDAFGAPAVRLNLTATAVNDSTDLFGAAQVRLNLTATAVDDQTDAFGAAQIALVLSSTGVDDRTDAFGSASITTGPVSLTATGVLNADGFGFATISTGPVLVQQTAFDDTVDAFGTPAVTRGAVTVTASGVDDRADGYGTSQLALNLAASGSVNTSTTGSAAIVPGAVNLLAAGVPSNPAFGFPAVDTQSLQTIEASGVSNTSQIGTATVVPAGPLTLQASSTLSTVVFGAASVQPGPVQLSAQTAVAGASIGSPTVTPGAVTIQPSPVLLLSGFGGHSVLPGPVSVVAAGVVVGPFYGSPIVLRLKTTPRADRIVMVAPETRLVLVPPIDTQVGALDQPRLVIVAPEDRSVEVLAEQRTASVPPEARLALVP